MQTAIQNRRCPEPTPNLINIALFDLQKPDFVLVIISIHLHRGLSRITNPLL
jgi:hypothetical protein